CFEALVDLRTEKSQMLALRFAVGAEKCRANISFIGQAGRVFPKRVVEICEVWQSRDVLHQRVDPCREGALYDASTFRKPFVNSLRDLDQHLYQMCDVTAGVVDVG